MLAPPRALRSNGALATFELPGAWRSNSVLATFGLLGARRFGGVLVYVRVAQRVAFRWRGPDVHPVHCPTFSHTVSPQRWSL
jgi:hypothetical protein